MNEPPEEEWDRVSRALFRKPEPTTRAQTELFVRTIMDRVEPAPIPWLTPVLAFTAAAFFFFLASPLLPDAAAAWDEPAFAAEMEEP
jgi:hypothetical protein